MWQEVILIIGITMLITSFFFEKDSHFRVINLIGVEMVLFYMLLKQILSPIVLCVFLVGIVIVYLWLIYDEMKRERKINKKKEENKQPKRQQCYRKDENGYDVIIIGKED